jgi:uncharacterized protein (DUF58 family)
VSVPSAQGDERVSVSARALVALRAAGQGLALPPARPPAREAGEHASPLKGRGVEFEESRPYQPGDDARTIDWRVTARTGRTHTKLFREERERPVLLCTDFRAGMFFATRGAFKSVVAARATALLAWRSHHHGDRVGGLLFDETRHRELRPRRDKSAVLTLIHQLADFGRWTGPVLAPTRALPLSSPLARLARVARPGSLVFVISDFRVLDADVERHLSRIARHGSVVLVAIHDPLESEPPPPGRYRLSDGRREAELDTTSATVRERHRQRFSERRETLQGLARRHGMAVVAVTTTTDLPAALGSELVRRAAA